MKQVILSPDEFRLKAMYEGWDEKTVELFLQPPLCSKYIEIGKAEKTRQLVKVK